MITMGDLRLILVCFTVPLILIGLVGILPAELTSNSARNQAGVTLPPTYASQTGITFAATYNTTLLDQNSQTVAGLKLGSWLVDIYDFGPSNGTAPDKGSIVILQDNFYLLSIINIGYLIQISKWAFQGNARCHSITVPNIFHLDCTGAGNAAPNGFSPPGSYGALNATMMDADYAAFKSAPLVYSVQLADTSFHVIFYWNTTAYAKPSLAWASCDGYPLPASPAHCGNRGLKMTVGADFSQSSPNTIVSTLTKVADIAAPDTGFPILGFIVIIPWMIGILIILFKLLTSPLPTVNS